jgi:hypothetical protein
MAGNRARLLEYHGCRGAGQEEARLSKTARQGPGIAGPSESGMGSNEGNGRTAPGCRPPQPTARRARLGSSLR